MPASARVNTGDAPLVDRSTAAVNEKEYFASRIAPFNARQSR
jgi:hypothetical protein